MTLDPRNDFYPVRHSCFLSFWTDMSTSRHNQSKHMVKTRFWIDGYIFVLLCNPSEQSWNSAGALTKISLSNQQNTHTHMHKDTFPDQRPLQTRFLNSDEHAGEKKHTHICTYTHNLQFKRCFFPPEYHVIVPFIGYICSLHPPCYMCIALESVHRVL